MSIENKSWQFLAMWDMYGLEALINITEKEQENMISVLKGEKPKHTNPIQFMIIRANANTQRCYEIYAFNSEVDEVSLREAFEYNPQFIVELIREKGEKLYSARNTRQPVIT